MKEVLSETAWIKTSSLSDIEKNEILSGLYDQMREIDPETFIHSNRVCDISLIIGLYYNLNLHELISLATGALLHDVGKLFIDEKILNKPDRFTRNEKLIMQMHPSLGYKKIMDCDVDASVMEIVKYHHERLDGSGNYGLTAQKLGICTQIVTVTDIYDAIISKRCYKEQREHSDAIRILRQEKGINQHIVDAIEENKHFFPVSPEYFHADKTKTHI